MSTALAVYHGAFGRATLYKLDRPLATHAHREGHLIFHVSGEPSRFVVSGQALALMPRSAVAINPWQPHSFEPGDRQRNGLILVLYIRPIWYFEIGRCARTAFRFGRSSVNVTLDIHRLVQLIAAMLLDDEISALFDGHLYQLAQTCFDQTWQSAPDRNCSMGAWTRSRDYRIRNSIRLMHERMSDELVLDDIARDSGLSRPHFYKLFLQHVGLTPNTYLNTLRMETAIERLIRSADSVTAIGLDLGFAAQASFTRFFTSNVGIPPSDYRRIAHHAV